MVRATVVTVMR